MHNRPHTDAAKAKMSAATKGKPRPWKHRPTQVIDGVMHYRCGSCKRFFQKEDFHRDKRTMLGIKTQCKGCHNATSVRSRDKSNKREKAVGYESARRARKAGSAGRVTADDWRALTGILGTSCLACGSLEQPTWDHIIPLAKSGMHHPLNIQPLCRPCNERKQARIADYRTPEQRIAVDKFWVVEFRRLEGAQ